MTLEGARILFVLESLELGGAERQALHLARGLARDQGARVEVWGLLSDGPVSDLCAESGLDCRAAVLPQDSALTRVLPAIGDRTWLVWAVSRLSRELRRSGAEIVLPYTMLPNVLCGVAASWSGGKTVIWNQRDVGLGRMGRTLESLAVRNIGRFLANSREGRVFLERDLGVELARITVVPNGVEAPVPARSRAEWRAAHGFGDRDFLLCMLANLHENKDHETLLHAFAAARDRWPLADRPPRLLLAGRPDATAERLERLARELRIESEVRFPGGVTDVGSLLCAADLGVFSSRREGCPNGVLECMAAGLALAATDVPGIRDAVGDAGAPFLAPAGDAAALARTLLLAAADGSLRSRIGREMKLRAAAEFSLGKMVATTAAILARERSALSARAL